MTTLAIHGGTPVRTEPIGQWPVWGAEEELMLLQALRSGTWGSIDGTFVKRLEVEFAEFQGARYGVACLLKPKGVDGTASYKSVLITKKAHRTANENASKRQSRVYILTFSV